MKSRIKTWGKDLALKIPKSAAAVAGLVSGAEVEIQAYRGRLVIQPLAYKKKYSLASLLKGVRKSNLPEEIDFGPPVGKEVW